MAMRVSVVAEAILHSLPLTSSHSPPSPHFRLATPPSGPCGHSCVLLSPVAVSGQSRNPYTLPEFSTALQDWGSGVGVKLGWSVMEVGITVGVNVGWGVGVEVEGGVVGPDMMRDQTASLIERHVMISHFFIPSMTMSWTRVELAHISSSPLTTSPEWASSTSVLILSLEQFHMLELSDLHWVTHGKWRN